MGILIEYRRSEREPRIPSNEPVWIRNGRPIRGWTVNRSRNGLCVMTERRLRAGAVVTVELPERCDEATARVVWCRRFPDGYIVGLRILERTRRAA